MFQRVIFLSALCAVTVSYSSVSAQKLETAIFAGGCFWCVESDFETQPGVISAVSGFTGGSSQDADYKKVTKGNTGHKEAVKITFDADILSYEKLVNAFLRSIDPTDSGGQFCDRGPSYATVIYTSSNTQKSTAEKTKSALAARGGLPVPIVTPILNAGEFFAAGDDHQDYYKKTQRVLTRFGLIPKSVAYKKYRLACGRDARVRDVWGLDAFLDAGF